MSAASYSPGDWIALTTDRMWLMVDIPPDDDRVHQLWLAASSANVDETLSILVAGGLSRLPAFAVAARSGDGLRVVVRHPARIVRRVADAELEVNGPVGGTWTDSVSTSPTSELRIETPRGGASVMLPLGHGVTTAGVLAVDLTEQSEGRAGSGSSAGAMREARVDADAPLATSDLAPSPVSADGADLDDLPADPSPSSGPDRGSDEPAATRSSDFYGQLLGSTVDRDALLAQIEEELDASEGPAEQAALAASGETAIWEGSADVEVEDPVRLEDERPASSLPDTAAPSVSDPSPLPGVIDGVPWAASAGAPAPSAPAAPAADARRREARERPPVDAPAASHSARFGSPPEAEMAAQETDTTNRSELLPAAEPGAESGVESTPDQRVLAVVCPAEHVTSAYASTCRVCGAIVAEQEPTEVVRPPLGTLRLSTGQSVLLDRDVVLGRAPEDGNVDPALRPHLVQLTESPEVSRMHVRVTLDGWQPVIRDLGSSNGTTLTLLGSEPRQLRPQEDYPLEPGCEVVLADTVSFTYDVGA